MGPADEAAALSGDAGAKLSLRWRRRSLGDGVALLESTSGADWPQVQPAGAAAMLKEALLTMPGVGVVGAKRLSAEGKVAAMGEWVVHPKGYHAQGRGLPGHAYRFVEEVDAVSCGALAVRESALDLAGGDAALHATMGALELCLKVRRTGGRVAAVPQVVATDGFVPHCDLLERKAFAARWGFDWRAADLAAVAAMHAGTGLLWNLRFHARGMPFEKYAERPAVHWSNYQNVEVYRKRADHLAGIVGQVRQHSGNRVLDLGCGDGLFTHLFAQAGATVTGVDPEAVAIEQAREQMRLHTYPAGPPTLLTGMGDALPLAEGVVDVVTMLDVIEHLPNPVRVLREVERVLASKGFVVLSTPAWQVAGWSDPVYHVTEYTAQELVDQIHAATGLRVVNVSTISGAYRDVVVAARKG